MSTNTVIAAFAHEFNRHRTLMERAMESVSDAQFFARPADHVNSIALIVKHLSGSMTSRWTDFLTSDGEKPTRDRDGEFVAKEGDTRATLMDGWARGWRALTATLNKLTDSDLDRQITIRGEPHTVFQALLRGVDHVAYHAGQITYLARLFCPNAEWLTIAPGKSKEHRPSYLKPPGA